MSGSRVPTGISGLDRVLDGGVPHPSTTLVLGGPGAGKTLFALQMLAADAGRARAPGIFVTFEESPARLRDTLRQWPARSARSRVTFVDGRPLRDALHGGSFDLLGLLAQLDARVKTLGARRVAFDGLDMLLHLLADSVEVRREVYRVHDWLADRRVTGIVTSQVDDGLVPVNPRLAFLPYMADGIVSLQHRLVGRIAERTLRVVKCRWTAHASDELPILIGGEGLEVMSSAPPELTYAAGRERVSSGVARLDAMLEGGYFRGSCTLVSGAPGTAKTTLAGAFAEAATTRGERTWFVSFDESGPQVVRNLASVGLRLTRAVRSGMLHLEAMPVRGRHLEVHLNRVEELVAGGSFRHVVIDPVSAFGHSGTLGDAQDGAVRLVNGLKSRGVTLVLTSLLAHDVGGSMEATSTGVSTIADTWIHLSYVAHGGERNRALTIVKSRGTAHSSQVRELVLSRRGVSLADVYTAGGDVLMGTLRWEREEQERARLERERADQVRARAEALRAIADARGRLDLAHRELAEREAELARWDDQVAGTARARHAKRRRLGRRRGEDAP